MAEADGVGSGGKPGNDHEEVGSYGTVLLVLGGVLCFGALLIGEGEPAWQVLAVFMLVVVVGLVLRIEAAVRGR